MVELQNVQILNFWIVLFYTIFIVNNKYNKYYNWAYIWFSLHIDVFSFLMLIKVNSIFVALLSFSVVKPEIIVNCKVNCKLYSNCKDKYLQYLILYGTEKVILQDQN